MLLKAKHQCHEEDDRLFLDKWNEYLYRIHKWRGWDFGCVAWNNTSGYYIANIIAQVKTEEVKQVVCL